MSLRELAGFAWQDFTNPIDGLVPLAYNGAGEPYCWLTNEQPKDGELPIIAAMHGGEGYWFAPNVAGMIFRNALMWYDLRANQGDLQSIYARLPRLLEILDAQAPKTWGDTLRQLRDRPTKHQVFGTSERPHEQACLHLDGEREDLIRNFFGEQYVGKEIVWETPDR
ncbi:MAG: hypothetical protein ACE37H_02590 [Phycisphaeraceae bacterium]